MTTDIQDIQQSYLHSVIQKIMMRQKSTAKKYNFKNEQLNQLSKQMGNMLQQFDLTIKDCKQYNQAKIHRKYQIRIADLQKQIIILNDKIKIQKDARDPSKKYIQDLLNQLVVFKHQNLKLKAQIQEANKTINQLNNKVVLTSSQHFNKSKIIDNINTITPVLQKQQKSIFDQTIEVQQHYPILKLKIEVEQYLKNRTNQRKLRGQIRSVFESFLRKIRNNLDNMTPLNQFLQRVDEWSSQIVKRHQHYNPQKVKSNVLASLQSQIGLPKINAHNMNYHVNYRSIEQRSHNNLNVKRKHYSTIDTTVKQKKYSFTLK